MLTRSHDGAILPLFGAIKALSREKYMVHDEVCRLLNHVKNHRESCSRDYYTLFRFLAETGVRVQAAMGMRLMDLIESPGGLPRVRVRWLKKRGAPAEQEIMVSEDLAKLIRRQARGRKPDRRLWSMSDRAVRYAFTRYCDGAGIRIYSPKALRHYHLLQFYHASGNDIRLTQDRAGHASIVTTTIYLATEDSGITAAVAGLPTLP
ncbi:MAG: tyrosine-type recombinase/integrase [Syntrophales bacterium]|nr:tyrosine-type recombinase/integrase [Syntrophales bacterium]